MGLLRALRPGHGPHFAAAAAAAEEPVAAVGLENRDTGARRHFELFEHVAVARVQASERAFIAFPRGVPQLALDPRHTRDKAVRFDRAQYLARLRIDLMNLARPILTAPQRAFRPGAPRLAAD